MSPRNVSWGKVGSTKIWRKCWDESVSFLHQSARVKPSSPVLLPHMGSKSRSHWDTMALPVRCDCRCCHSLLPLAGLRISELFVWLEVEQRQGVWPVWRCEAQCWKDKIYTPRNSPQMRGVVNKEMRPNQTKLNVSVKGWMILSDVVFLSFFHRIPRCLCLRSTFVS